MHEFRLELLTNLVTQLLIALVVQRRYKRSHFTLFLYAAKQRYVGVIFTLHCHSDLANGLGRFAISQPAQ